MYELSELYYYKFIAILKESSIVAVATGLNYDAVSCPRRHEPARFEYDEDG